MMFVHVSPEHHHVHGVVCEAGDQRRQRDDADDGQQEVRAAVGTRGGPGVARPHRDAAAAGVELQTRSRERVQGRSTERHVLLHRGGEDDEDKTWRRPEPRDCCWGVW